MKLTNNKLKQIIKEEVQKALTEDKKSEYEAAAQNMSDKRLAARIKLMQSTKKSGGLSADGELRLKVLKAEAAKRKTA